MKRCMRKAAHNNKGFTLIELVLVLPLIVIVLTLGYNMYFLTQRSFASVNRSFDVSEQLRMFQMDIQKEASQAQKSETAYDAVDIVDSSIYIFADVTGDSRPERIRYQLVGTDLQRSVMSPTTSAGYPYTYPVSYSTTETVLSNVSAFTLDGNDYINAPRAGETEEEKDHRMKLHMKITVAGGSSPIELEGYLVSKSRTLAE